MCNIKSKSLQILFPCLVFLMVLSMCFFINGTAGAENCPSGSYTKSCNTLDCNGETMTAHCKQMNGSWNNNAEITGYNSCSGDIANCDGKLRCTCGTSEKPCPSGSYKNSCFCCSINPKWNDMAQAEQNQLCCWCKNKKGKYSSGEQCISNYEGCKKMSDGTTYTIWNDNGSLKCDR